MGTKVSRCVGFSSPRPRPSRARIQHGRGTIEDVAVGELVPERYLVLLTEQMAEMLFRLMTCNETSMMTSDHHTAVSPPSSPGSGRASLQLQAAHQPCASCQIRILTIEEFHELHQAFRRVDGDYDNFLTRDEIRQTLNHLFELTEDDVKDVISVFDTNKDDRISLEEYIDEMKHRLLHEFTREEIQAAFDKANSQQRAHLTVEELKNAIGYLNLHLPNRRVLEIINDCVTSEAVDAIDFSAFVNVIQALHCREPITLQKFKPIHHLSSALRSTRRPT